MPDDREDPARSQPYAHLMGGPAKTPTQTEIVTFEDSAPKPEAKAKDDDKDDDRSNDGDNASAEDESEKEEKEDDDDEGDEKKGKKAKKAKAKTKAEDEDDDADAEMRGSSVAASARLRERARCAAIFQCAAAGKNPALAAHYAFDTRMTRSEAIGALKAATAYLPERNVEKAESEDARVGRVERERPKLRELMDGTPRAETRPNRNDDSQRPTALQPWQQAMNAVAKANGEKLPYAV